MRLDRALDELGSLFDLQTVPERSVLILEQHQLAGRARPRGPSSFVKQHQRKQPEDFGFGQQFREKPSQPDCLAR